MRILITDRAKLEPVRAGLEIAVQIRRLFESQWDESLRRPSGRPGGPSGALDGETASRIAALYEDELKEFRKRREAF